MTFQTSYLLIEKPSSFTAEALRRALQSISDAGYRGVEMNLTEPLGPDLDVLEGWLEELNLVIPSFLTGGAYTEGLCLSAPDLAVRRRTVERLIGYLDTARRFNSILVIGFLQGHLSDEPNAAVANERIATCLRDVCDAAVDYGVDIVLEPINHLQSGFNNTIADVLDLIRQVDSPALHLMLDTIHMNIEERSIVQGIQDSGSRIRHFHLCESHAGLPGTGHVNYAEVLAALEQVRYEHFISVKIYRGPRLEEAAPAAMAYLRTSGLTA